MLHQTYPQQQTGFIHFYMTNDSFKTFGNEQRVVLWAEKLDPFILTLLFYSMPIMKIWTPVLFMCLRFTYWSKRVMIDNSKFKSQLLWGLT